MTLDVAAGQLLAALQQRGIPAHTRVHVLVEVPDDVALPITALALAGSGFDFLADEPAPYTDKDLVERSV